jgi:chaperonin GroES
MSKTYIEPAGDHVIVAEGLQENTLDGITLPDNAKQQEMRTGVVVFTGPDVSKYTKVTNVVLYGPFAGKNIIVDGIEFRLLREGMIEAYLRKSN